jgi:outer membrane protein OmpA-like peptidoglycan-associated protein
VTPFVEWSFEIPVGLPDLANAAGASAWPNILSLGARVSPWKQLNLLAAFDIGITSSGRLGVPAVPPWQFIFGLGWAFDTSAAPAQVVVQEKVKEVIKEKVVTKEVLVPTPMAPTTGVLTGQVIDSRTAQPVPGAAIKFPGTEHTAALTGEAKGDFKISDLPAGRLRVRVEKDGFKPADFEVDIVAGKPTANSFPVDQAEKVTAMAVLAGKVADEGGNPLTGIVEAREAKSGETKKLVAEPSTGGFVGRLPVGQYVVMARSTGYLSREKTITLNPNERVVVDFTLRKEPEKRIARLEGSKIVIAKQVNFKRASAKIIGKESFAILDEVVDILVRHPNIKKIRVEGHTDNVGGKGYNQKLSESRARSVMEYVVSQGIPPTRLESQGFGQTKPLVPNTSKRNKAKNRRVDFVIVDQ